MNPVKQILSFLFECIYEINTDGANSLFPFFGSQFDRGKKGLLMFWIRFNNPG